MFVFLFSVAYFSYYCTVCLFLLLGWRFFFFLNKRITYLLTYLILAKFVLHLYKEYYKSLSQRKLTVFIMFFITTEVLTIKTVNSLQWMKLLVGV